MIETFLSLKEIREEIVRAAYGMYVGMTAVLFFFGRPKEYEAASLLGLFFLLLFYRENWKKRGLILLAVFSLDFACFLGVSFYFSENQRGGLPYQEMAVCVMLLLICEVIISHLSFPKQWNGLVLETKQMLLLLLVPAVSIVVMAVLQYGSFPSGGGTALICLGLLVINLCVFCLYHALLKTYTHLREADIYKQQVSLYQNQLEVIQESQTRIRALRHDMKNHILELQAMIQQDKRQDLAEYLNQMQRFMLNPAEIAMTGNESIDSVLNYKVRKAKDVLSDVQTKISIPEKMNLHSFDLNVILGNLLDNAIEAAVQSKEKKLSLSLRMDKGVLFLRIGNSCIPCMGGQLNTRKADRENHGMGLETVRRIVEKYNGDMDMIRGGVWFQVDVCAKLSEGQSSHVEISVLAGVWLS